MEYEGGERIKREIRNLNKYVEECLHLHHKATEDVMKALEKEEM